MARDNEVDPWIELLEDAAQVARHRAAPVIAAPAFGDETLVNRHHDSIGTLGKHLGHEGVDRRGLVLERQSLDTFGGHDLRSPFQGQADHTDRHRAIPAAEALDAVAGEQRGAVRHAHIGGQDREVAAAEIRLDRARLAQELDNIQPAPPALRFFDAGVGDGRVLARFLRVMHRRFERLPFYIAAKEISLEDIRLTLDKMPDRFFEHPEMVLALTNLPYADAPWLSPHNAAMAEKLAWKEVPLKGSTAADFERQILELQPFLADHWRTRVSEKSGVLLPETPTVLVLYREDCRFVLDQVIPRRESPRSAPVICSSISATASASMFAPSACVRS